MKQDESIALFRYWNRLRNGRPAPERTEIEPAHIKSLLADTFILERDMRGKAVFRLAGTRVCSIYGRELRSLSFPSLWRQQDQRLIDRLCADVFGANAIVVVAFQGTSRNGRSNPFEMIALPLDGGVDNPRCLGVMSAAGRPFWLGADPIVDAAIESFRIVDPDSEPMNRPGIEVPALAPSELPASADAAGRSGSRRIRHLVVHEGGRTE